MNIKKPSFVLKFLFIIAFSASFLLACSKQKEPELPFDELMQKARQAIVNTEFGTLNFDLLLTGKDVDEEVKGEGQIDFLFDRTGDTPEQQLRLFGKGQLDSQEKQSALNVDVTFLRAKGLVQDQLYMNLKNLNLEGNPQFKAIQPMIQAYFGKWLKIPPEQLPETFQQLQLQKDLLQQEEELVKQVFVSTQLFDLQEYYGVEKAGAQKAEAYHYRVSLNEAGVQNYNRQVAQILEEKQLTPQDLTQVTAGLKYIQSLELWIDTETYRVVQAKLVLSGENLLQKAQGGEVDMEIGVTMQADFKTPVNLEPPTDFLDLDALGIFTQASELPVVQQVQLEDGANSNSSVPSSQESPTAPTGTQGVSPVQSGPQGFDDGN